MIDLKRLMEKLNLKRMEDYTPKESLEGNDMEDCDIYDMVSKDSENGILRVFWSWDSYSFPK